MAWTTPVADGDDLFCLSAGYPLGKLIDEVNDRVDFTGMTMPNSGRDYLSMSVGGDPTTCRFWNSYTNGTDDDTRFTSVDCWLLGGSPGNFPFTLMNWFDNPLDPGNAFNALNIVDARTYLGLPVTVWPDGGVVPNRFMLRKRYRTFNNILGTATQDDQFNAAVAGQRALDTFGNQWLCVASGNWVRDDNGTPDIISNTQVRPNNVVDIGTFWGSSPTTRPMGYVGYGHVQPGDILGAWVFEERRQLLSLMTTLAAWV